MTPSADRTASVADNEATFLLTNIVPQAPENNQGLWAQLEDHARDLVAQGNEVYIISGGSGSRGTLAGGKVTIPTSVWKAMVVLPAAGGDDAARVTATTQVIAVWTPNDATVASKTWQDYTVTVECIEQRTGLDLFAAVADAVETAIEGAGCEAEPLPSPTPPTLTPTTPTVTPTTPTAIGVFLPLVRAVGTTVPVTLTPITPMPITPTPITPTPITPTPITPTPITPTPASVAITAIEYDPPGDDVVGEYVIIRNGGGSAVSMTGWTLRDLANNAYTFPAFTLAAGAEVRVWTGSDTNNAANLYWGRGQAVWNNSGGDTAILRDASGTEVARFTYP